MIAEWRINNDICFILIQYLIVLRGIMLLLFEYKICCFGNNGDFWSVTIISCQATFQSFDLFINIDSLLTSYLNITLVNGSRICSLFKRLKSKKSKEKRGGGCNQSVAAHLIWKLVEHLFVLTSWKHEIIPIMGINL